MEKEANGGGLCVLGFFIIELVESMDTLWPRLRGTVLGLCLRSGLDDCD